MSSHSSLPVKKEPSELESITKRKSRSESNDGSKKKKKPALAVNGSSQSSIHDDIKPEKIINGETSRSLCGICFHSKTDPGMFKTNGCNHSFCVDCISKYVDSHINNTVVICPIPNCYMILKPEHLENIISGETIDQWEFAMYKSKIPLEQKTYCPFENCSVLLLNDNPAGEGEVVVTSCECPYCHRLFCAQCRVPWHSEMNCQEFQNLKVPKQEKVG